MRVGIIVCFLVALSGLNGLYAQDGRHCRHKLFGKVIDSETLEPLVYARVFIRELNKGVWTGDDGEFRLEGLCDGPLVLTVEHIGCETVNLDITIKENTHLDVTLPHLASHQLETVHIHDEHPGPKYTQSSGELDGRQLQQTRGKSLGEALLDINGVNALQTGPSIFKPVIQGLHSNRVLILNNGVRQEGQQWGSEHGPEIDPFIANKLTVVKGAAGVRYGPDAIAGVVLVEPAALPDSIGIGGTVNLVGQSNGRLGAASGILEGKLRGLGGMSWRTQGTVRRGGNVRTPDYFLGNTALAERNFSAAIGWERPRYGLEVFQSVFSTRIGIFTGAHIGNLTDLQNAIERDRPLQSDRWDFSYDIGRPAQNIVHVLTKANAHRKTGENGELKALYARQYNLRQEYDKHSPRNDSLAALDLPELHYEVVTHRGELIWEHHKVGQWRGEVGLIGQTQKNTYRGTYIIPNYRAHRLGAFAVQRLVRLRWELEAGARFDYQYLRIWRRVRGEIISPSFNWANASGTVGALYRINPHLTFSANMGTAWRPPQVNEMFSDGLHHGTASVEIGNPDLVPEQSFNFIAGLKYSEHNHITAEINAYHNYILNFIQGQPQLPPTLTIRGAFPTFVYRQMDVRLIGGDYKLGYSIADPLYLEVFGSVVRAENLDENEPLILMPADRFGGKVRYELASREVFRNSYAEIEYAYTREQTRVPENQDYADPPPGYGLVSGNIGTQLLTEKEHVLDIGLSVTNALNVRYRNYLNRFRYYADEMGRNITLRLKYNF